MLDYENDIVSCFNNDEEEWFTTFTNVVNHIQSNLVMDDFCIYESMNYCADNPFTALSLIANLKSILIKVYSNALNVDEDTFKSRCASTNLDELHSDQSFIYLIKNIDSTNKVSDENIRLDAKVKLFRKAWHSHV